MQPVLREVGQQHDGDKLHDPGAGFAPRSGPCRCRGRAVDEVRRRKRQKGQDLDQQRRHQIVEQVLAPFLAQHDLFVVFGQDPFDQDEQRAGEQHVDDEEVEAHEQPAELIVAVDGRLPIRWQAASPPWRSCPASCPCEASRARQASAKPANRAKIEERLEQPAGVDAGKLGHPRQGDVDCGAARSPSGRPATPGRCADRARQPARAECSQGHAVGLKLRTDLGEKSGRIHGVPPNGIRSLAHSAVRSGRPMPWVAPGRTMVRGIAGQMELGT